MPDVPTIGKTDQALTSTAAGDILMSAGPGRVPVVAPAGVKYSAPDVEETITAPKNYLGPTGDYVVKVYDETQVFPYDIQTFHGADGQIETGRWITISQKRKPDGLIEGIANELSMLGVSADVNGSSLQLENHSVNNATDNKYLLAGYDLSDPDPDFPAGPYSPGSGKKKFALSPKGEILWGDSLKTTPHANRLGRLWRSTDTGNLTFEGDPAGPVNALDLLSPSGGASEIGLGRDQADGDADLRIKAQSSGTSAPSITFDVRSPSGVLTALAMGSRLLVSAATVPLARIPYLDLVGGLKLIDAAGATKGAVQSDGSLALGAASGNYVLTLGGASRGGAYYGLSTAAAVSGDILNYANVTGAITGSLNGFYWTAPVSGKLGSIQTNSNSTSPTAHSVIEVATTGESGGDPKVTWTISGVLNVSAGLDNSDGNRWKLSASDSLGTNDCISVDMTSRVVSMPAGMAGGSTAAQDFQIWSTTHPTKGKIRFGANAYYDESTKRLTVPGRDGPIASNTDASTITLDLIASDLHLVTLGGNRTLAVTGATTGQRFTVKLVQSGAGSWNPTWWSGITWYTADGNKPTPASATGKGTYVQFVTTGAGTYDGFLIAPQS